MLEIQIVRRSRNNVAVPVARSDNPELVQYVARAIAAQMQRWKFKDELLAKCAEHERRAFAEILAEEGMKLL